MTEKLYYKDAYMREFDAHIVEVSTDGSDLLIRLDETAFYPEGGGQGADHGVMRTPSGFEISIVDVHEKDGDIWHSAQPEEGEAKQAVSAAFPELQPGQAVHGCIDWERRFDHMQQHSGEHIVSGMICSAFDCDNVGFHMGEDTVTIDYNVRISPEEAAEIEARANQYIWEDHPFIVMWPDADELKRLDYRSKKELSGEVRITSFPGADMCACCGTHVSSSAQVGLVKLVSAKNFHEGTRIEMYCGKRALDFLSAGQAANKETAVLLSTSEENTPSRVQHLIEENTQLKSQVSALADRMLEVIADRYNGQENILIIDDDLPPEQGRQLADMISDRNDTLVAVFTKAGGVYRYALIHKGADISALVKDMNAALFGRGGGRNGFAQGSAEAGPGDIRAFFDTRIK